jgi:hypothetical protein
MALFDDASLVTTPNGYKAGTLYSIKPTSGAGDMTVVRATTATRVNSAGLIESVAINVPRLDYTDSTCPSLLLEPQRTNLMTYSQQLNQWSILGGITVTENNEISPDGTQNADRAQFTLSTDLLYRSGTGSAGSNTLTVYAKAKSGSSQKFRFFGNGGLSYSSDQVATNQWQRFTFTYTYSTTTAGLAGATTGAGDVLFYGFQHEIGSYATSYIPTTTAAVTRNADEIYKTGISSLINSTEGVLFIETKGLFDAPPISTYIQLSKNGESGFDNSLVLQHRNNGYLRVYVNGSATTNLNFNIDIDFTQNHKIAVLYKLNGYKLFIDGVAQSLFGTPTQTVFSGLDNLSFDLRGSNSWNAKIKNLIVFPSALSDTELTELTTL